MQRYKEMCKKPNICPYFFSMDGGIDVEHVDCLQACSQYKGHFLPRGMLCSHHKGHFLPRGMLCCHYKGRPTAGTYCYFCPVA